jgi:hypothetical protein
MDIPEDLSQLVDRLGQALVQAMATDPACRELVMRIQALGYDMGLMFEATVALHRRETLSETPNASESASWSEDDKAFLKTFKISLD